MRTLALVLILPIATTGSLPLWAQLAGVEGPHVCQCSIEKHDCICAKCNPDHEGSAEMALSSESLKGRCGDDEIAFGGKSIRAVLSGVNHLAPLGETVTVFAQRIDPFGVVMPPPPTPPPRERSFTVV